MTKAQKSKLVVVESPNKVKTIEKILGEGYVVRATVGHIADIPTSAGAVQPDADFAATYELTDKGREVVAQLKRDLKMCDELILATDDDREGELIAVHVVEFVNPKVPVKRVAFRAVTREAVLEAMANPRDIDRALVEAARTRRILDRLFGYEVTDVARRKVRRDARAGRVQSPALRLVVEREFERLAFVASLYRDVVVTAGEPGFEARLVVVGGERLAQSRDFDASGALTSRAVVLDAERAAAIAEGLESGVVPLVVADVKSKGARRAPAAPLTMSTLIQEAANRIGMSSEEASSAAQQLFDKGKITYPRADAAVHSAESRREIRAEIERRFGVGAVSADERFTSVKGKRVQGAHEAIRPTDMGIDDVAGEFPPGIAALYRVVWQRTMASQMRDATGSTTTLRLVAGDAEFRASGTVWTEAGWRRVLPPRGEEAPNLPVVGVGEVLHVSAAEVQDHETQPPARFTEASLVRELEELGIGRPSTYTKIIAKLRERYVWSHEGDRALIPTLSAIPLHALLVGSFGAVVDYGFTNEMEERLDTVASGTVDGREVLDTFWQRLAVHAAIARGAVDPRDMVVVRLGVHPTTGEEVVVRAGRFRKTGTSPYVKCGSRHVNVSDRTPLGDLTLAAAIEMLDRKSRETRDLGVHPEIGVPVVVGASPTGNGHYLQIGARKEVLPGFDRPLFIGLPEGTDPEAIDNAAVSRLYADEMRRRRLLGVDDSGRSVWLIDGRFGPYVHRGKDNRSLPKGVDPTSLGLDEALEILARPKSRRRRVISD